MVKRKRSVETIVGIFVLASSLLLLAIVILIGRQQNIFEKRYVIFAEFESVAGLQSGAEVHLAGISVGYVQSVEFNANDKVFVRMSVSQGQAQRIRADSWARIRTMGLMGDRYVEITVGSPTLDIIEPGGSIKTVEHFELGDMLEEARPTLQNIEETVKNLAILTKELADPSGELDTILKNIRELTTAAREGKGTVGALLTDDELYAKAVQTLDTTQLAMEDLREVSASAKEASAELPEILKSINSSVAEFEQFSETATRAASGVAGLVDSGQKVMNDAEVISANLKSTTEDIKQAAPKLTSLLVSTEEAVNEAREIVEAAKQNWLLKGYFDPSLPREPVVAGGRDEAAPEVVR